MQNGHPAADLHTRESTQSHHVDLLQHIAPSAQLRGDRGWLSPWGCRHLLPVSLGRRAAAALCTAAVILERGHTRGRAAIRHAREHQAHHPGECAAVGCGSASSPWTMWVCKQIGGHWTYQNVLRLVLDAQPLPQDRSMLCPLAFRDSKLTAASPQLGSSRSHRHKSARSAHATRHRRWPSPLTSLDAAR